jgi:hypothetical protein
MSETSNFTREQATKGYKVVSNTSATAKNFYGFTVIAEAVISALVAPTGAGPEGTAYDGDEAGIATTLPVGYYPVRGSSITLTSGAVILWLE